MKKIIACTTYPMVMSLGLISHYWMLHGGFSIKTATYTPVIVGAFIITLMELKFSHRKKWLAEKSDLLNDTVYMVLVQVLLPRLLSFFVAITLLRSLQNSQWMVTGFWPHAWPHFLQAMLMILAADFLRYWLHKLSHEWPPLWRLHAVHHSPHKLYWVNVGRFHPVEKALQFIFDALPFILLGISEEVLALYFVFYSINGFFQHCNIELRLGFLNYIISGPELHRWHHSKLVEEANRNYGNNTIVWDLVFGTRFLPKDREVDELGLKNRSYPTGFVDQLKTPFLHKRADLN